MRSNDISPADFPNSDIVHWGLKWAMTIGQIFCAVENMLVSKAMIKTKWML